MRDKILEKSAELFLNLGFKSVTMDEIASALGVSKKTIYKYYSNKTKLIDEVTEYMFDSICTGIDMICDQKMNPIDELFSIKRFVMQHLNDEKSSPQYQLQKYYPKTYQVMKEKQFAVMHESIIENLERGIEMGVFRKSINKDFIARIYFNGMVGIKDKDIFPLDNFSMNDLMNYYLEYHLRGISTELGIKQLESQLQHK